MTLSCSRSCDDDVFLQEHIAGVPGRVGVTATPPLRLAQPRAGRPGLHIHYKYFSHHSRRVAFTLANQRQGKYRITIVTAQTR